MEPEKENKKQVHIHVDEVAREVYRREGRLPDIPQPHRVKIPGTITAVREFISKKKDEFKKERAYIVYSYKERTIKLVTHEEFENAGYEITGKLELADELKQLEVFTGKGDAKIYDPKTLIQILRFNKAFFADVNECDKLLEKIAKFRADITASFQQEQNERGNKSAGMKQEVKTDVPLDFKLTTPVFKGQPKKTYKVIVCFDIRDNRQVDFWFDSPELAEIMHLDCESIIQTELKEFGDYVCIEQ